ncbi:MAG: hypothetical protein LBF34_03440 [Puniceicoccales bacterium]|jgi:hypothetical protein|nr:hypothetical protein [Puniceicoccales bacterium]
MDRKGYLLIEVILGLSVFALAAGVVTHGFLLGLNLHKNAGIDSNEAVVTTLLINRIKQATVGTTFSIKLDKEEWELKLEKANAITTGVLSNLWALDISVAKIKDFKGNGVLREEKKYSIFRYLP